MKIYSKYILPGLTDWACSSAFLDEIRKKVVPLAKGRVLEIGIGSGFTLTCYNNARVEHLTGIDPSKAIWERRRQDLDKAGLDFEFVQSYAEALPFKDNAFDTVLSAYTMCTVKNPVQVLAEIRRVLKPGGSLIIAEHGLAPEKKLASFQNRINPLWKRIGGGCNLNRDMGALLGEAGFDTSELNKTYSDGWRATSYLYWGELKHKTK